MTEADSGPASGTVPGGTAPAPRKRTPWLMIVPIAVFGILAVIFYKQLEFGDLSDTVPSALIGNPVPPTTAAPLEGLTENGVQVPGFSPATFLGQVSVVNVFGSWCAPCRAEHPYIERLATDDRIQIVGINQRDATPNALSFLARFGNPYDVVGISPDGRVVLDWGVYGVPETFLVDRAGVIRYKVIGPIWDGNYDVVMAQIEALLAEPVAAPATTPPA